jgi:hypothetical protein
MSNIIYEDAMYNEDIKNKYLENFKTGTKNNIKRIFKVSRLSEEALKKDLYRFNREELSRLFYSFTCTTPAASKSTVQYVSMYLDWAVEEGYISSNPLDSVDSKWKEKFVVTPNKEYLTVDEVRDMLKEIVNAQVAVVFYAPFIGIRGTESSEITNLKKGDIDYKNKTVKLTNKDGSTRTIKVDTVFLDLCKEAIKENEFVKSNGNPDANLRTSETSPLVDNDFIVRSVDSERTINYNEADFSAIYRRFNTIKKVFDDMDLKITPRVLQRSGMLAMAKKYMQKGRLNDDAYEEIRLQFDLNELTMKRYKDEFLNEETVKSLYELT